MLDGNTGEQPTALSPDEGKRKVAALLGTPEADHAKPAERDTPVAKEPEEVTEATAYEDISSDDAEDNGSPAQADIESEPARYRLSDGTEVTADEVEEWRKGHLRQSDYTRKAQEVAAKRKAADEREAQIAQQAQYFDQMVPFAEELIRERAPAQPDESLLQFGTAEATALYLNQKAQYDAWFGKIDKLQNAITTRQNQYLQEQERVQKETFQNAQAELLRMMPELKDPAKVTALRTEIETALPKYGYTADDANHLMDPRQIAVLKDAIAYRKLVAAKPQAIDKAKDAIPVQQPGKRSSPGEAQAKARHEQMAKLRKTGDRNVGQSLIRQLIERGG